MSWWCRIKFVVTRHIIEVGVIIICHQYVITYVLVLCGFVFRDKDFDDISKSVYVIISKDRHMMMTYDISILKTLQT